MNTANVALRDSGSGHSCRLASPFDGMCYGGIFELALELEGFRMRGVVKQ